MTAVRLVSTGEATRELATLLADRTHLVAAGPLTAELADVARRLPIWRAWLVSGTGPVLILNGNPKTADMLAVLTVLATPAAAALAVPKTTRLAILRSAFGPDLPGDGSRDVITLTVGGGAPVWPPFLLNAIALTERSTA